MTNTSTAKGGRVADTSFLYALFSANDRFHGDAVREARESGIILIPSEIFSETIALIHYRQGFGAAEKSGRWLRRQPRVHIGASDDLYIKTAWNTFEAARGKLSYPDSIVASWCHKLRAKALAFDDNLKRVTQKND